MRPRAAVCIAVADFSSFFRTFSSRMPLVWAMAARRRIAACSAVADFARSAAMMVASVFVAPSRMNTLVVPARHCDGSRCASTARARARASPVTPRQSSA